LRAAQVLFYPDERPTEVRLNEEVRVLARVKFKEGVAKEKGEPIFHHEIENCESLQLLETEDPNSGHLTLLRLAGSWHLSFDFTYNKGRSKELLQAAKEFLNTAEHALEKGHLRAFTDNLFSAAELTATVFLITAPRPGERTDMSHGRVHSRFNQFARLGNVGTSDRETFNSLASTRTRARYGKGVFNMSLSEANSHLAAVKGLMEHAEALVKREQVGLDFLTATGRDTV
jgi:HEPN domain